MKLIKSKRMIPAPLAKADEGTPTKRPSWGEMRLLAVGKRFDVLGMHFDASRADKNDYSVSSEAQFDNGNWFPFAVSESIAEELELPILGWTSTILADGKTRRAPVSEMNLKFGDFTLIRVPVTIMPGNSLVGNPIYSLLDIDIDADTAKLNPAAIKRHLRLVGRDARGQPIYTFRVVSEDDLDDSIELQKRRQTAS